MAPLYHRDAEEKGMGNTRRPDGDVGEFLQPAEQGIAHQENEEGLANRFFPSTLLQLLHPHFLQEKCCHPHPV